MSIFSGLLRLFGRGKSAPKDEWTVAAGENDGKPMIVRFRSNPPPGVEMARYRFLMTVSWEYEPANKSGVPSEKDNVRMTDLENLLDHLESERTAFLMAVLTYDGIRAWQWYSRNHEESIQVLNTALSGHARFPVEICQEEDPEWSAYFGFRNGGQ